MSICEDFDEPGAGTLYTQETIGYVSRTQLLPEGMPETCVCYILSRNGRSRTQWILERLTDDTEMPDSCSDDFDGTPAFFYVYFFNEPVFDYLSFDVRDSDVYVIFDTGDTMNDVMRASMEDVCE